MDRVIRLLDAVNESAGKIISWFATILVWVICVDVVIRYLFDFTYIWINEIEIYFFAFLFLLSAGFAFQRDKHVRVDMFYSNWSEKRKAWVNLVGGILFLLPWSMVIIYVSYKYALNSWNIGEGSPQPGGLPALYILKFSIPIAFSLLFLQALSSILQSLKILTRTNI